jgi:hypothetical protein
VALGSAEQAAPEVVPVAEPTTLSETQQVL